MYFALNLTKEISGDVVVGQVAHFNLTPEASLCRGFNLLPFVLSKDWRAQMETCGQIACAVGRLPIRFTVGTGGTIINGYRRVHEKNNLGLTEQAVVKVNLAGHEKDFLSCYRFCFARFGRFRHVPTCASDNAFLAVSKRHVFAQL